MEWVHHPWEARLYFTAFQDARVLKSRVLEFQSTGVVLHRLLVQIGGHKKLDLPFYDDNPMLPWKQESFRYLVVKVYCRNLMLKFYTQNKTNKESLEKWDHSMVSHVMQSMYY